MVYHTLHSYLFEILGVSIIKNLNATFEDLHELGECGRNCFDRDLGYRIPDVRSFDNHSPAPLFRGFLKLSK